MAIKIWGRYRGRTEELDTAPNEKEADYLVREYRMAYGAEWLVWKGRKKNDQEIAERSNVRLRAVD